MLKNKIVANVEIISYGNRYLLSIFVFVVNLLKKNVYPISWSLINSADISILFFDKCIPYM